MAPEQVTGQNITEQVDVYAFGVLLFELLTGRKPITGDVVERIFYAILNEPLKLEPLHEAGVPEAICDLIARCTAKNPAERPQGFDPVCIELERAIAAGESPTPVLPTVARDAPTVTLPAAKSATPAAAPASRPAWLLPVVLLVIAGVGVGVYFALQSPAKVVEIPKKEAAAPAAALAPTLSTPGGEMMLVPAGDFQFGEKKETVALPAFYIDKTEVTNEAYGLFCKEKGYAPPAGLASAKPDYPVVNVSIQDAMAFAQWAGKRLPSAREWEKAARGTDGRIYPWGNNPDPAKANVGTGKVLPALALPEGASPFGALHMAGNVFELIDQTGTPSENMKAYFAKVLKPPPAPDENWSTIRGQAFAPEGKSLDPGVLFDSTSVPARWKDPNIGFRCVKDAK
jgi:serine/threonine-protein kinase